MPFDGTVYEGRARSLDKIDRVIGLLGDERRWCKQRLQTNDGQYCILGALRALDAELELSGPILDAIRQVTGRRVARIELFNDHPLTSHALVLRVLNQARASIANPLPYVVEPKVTPWARLRRAFG